MLELFSSVVCQACDEPKPDKPTCYVGLPSSRDEILSHLYDAWLDQQGEHAVVGSSVYNLLNTHATVLYDLQLAMSKYMVTNSIPKVPT
jgi:hypothetical protein